MNSYGAWCCSLRRIDTETQGVALDGDPLKEMHTSMHTYVHTHADMHGARCLLAPVACLPASSLVIWLAHST